MRVGRVERAQQVIKTRNLPPDKLVHTLLTEALTPSHEQEQGHEALAVVGQDKKELQRAQTNNHKLLRSEATPLRDEAKAAYKKSLGEVRQERSRLNTAHKKALREIHDVQNTLAPARTQRLREITDECYVKIKDGDIRIAEELSAVNEALFSKWILSNGDKPAIDLSLKCPVVQSRERRQMMCENPECTKGDKGFGLRKVFWTTRTNTRTCCRACYMKWYRLEHE